MQMKMYKNYVPLLMRTGGLIRFTLSHTKHNSLLFQIKVLTTLVVKISAEADSRSTAPDASVISGSL